jgi:hypothetical protein
MQSPGVKEHMASHRALVCAGLVQPEVDALVELNIGREQILAKWWEFANIDPKLTGYNTSGQSRALDSLWKALGLKIRRNQGMRKSRILKSHRFTVLSGCGNLVTQITRKMREKRPAARKPVHLLNRS